MNSTSTTLPGLMARNGKFPGGRNLKNAREKAASLVDWNGRHTRIMRSQGNRLFLTAEWRNLVMLNYEVGRGLLEPYVPAMTELDSFEGRTYVSLVGFCFNKTFIRSAWI